MKKLEYLVNDEGTCTKPCPHGNDAERPIGSMGCEGCTHFVAKNPRTKIVICGCTDPIYKDYIVTWDIDINATSPKEAVREAIEMFPIHGNDTEATMFTVSNPEDGTVEIDTEDI